jgi:hypothetical protein
MRRLTGELPAESREHWGTNPSHMAAKPLCFLPGPVQLRHPHYR